MLNEPATSLNDYKVGQVDDQTGQQIIYIIYQTQDFIVSIDNKLNLNWQTAKTYPKFAEDFGEVISACDLSDALVDRMFVGKKNRLAYKKMLGSVIARILDDQNSIGAVKQLVTVDQRLTEHCKERVRMSYILYAMLTVMLVSVVLILLLAFQSHLVGYGLDHQRYHIAMGILLGGLGAFITTFMRFKSYTGSLVAGLFIHRLDGFLRIFYGLIAGLIVMLAIKGNILVGFANSSGSSLPWLYYFLAMVSGASEALIPNLIKEAEGKISITATVDSTKDTPGKEKMIANITEKNEIIEQEDEEKQVVKEHDDLKNQEAENSSHEKKLLEETVTRDIELREPEAINSEAAKVMDERLKEKV